MRKLLITTCIVLALFPQSIADVLLKKGDVVRKGKGEEKETKILWVDCHGKKEEFDNKNKEYSIERGEDCKVPKARKPPSSKR